MLGQNSFRDVTTFAGFDTTIIGYTGTTAWGDLTGDGILDIVTPRLELFSGPIGPYFKKVDSF